MTPPTVRFLEADNLDSNPASSLSDKAGIADDALEAEIVAVGDGLLKAVRLVLDSLPRGVPGPQALARTLGVDKVLASRVLKATRSQDPMSAAHQMPGPDPLRRLIRAAGRRGVPAGAIAQAEEAIDRFEVLIRDQVGDRGLLDAILSAWIPDARREFELRRKQAAFKALSQLKGVQARTILATVVLAPSPDGEHIDVVWVNGLIGVHRVRPGVAVKLATRRMDTAEGARRPTTLYGAPIDTPESLPLRAFCTEPMPRLAVHRVGETVYYTLGERGFGADSAVDLVFAEVNRGELARYVPAGSARKGYFFAEVVPPAESLQFDVLVHADLYNGADPSLRIYDTAFEGVASVNDPARNIDRLDLLESIEPLGYGLGKMRSGDVPRYAELVKQVFGAVGFESSRFRAYRCRVAYPLYGSQVVMAFEGVGKAEG